LILWAWDGVGGFLLIWCADPRQMADNQMAYYVFTLMAKLAHFGKKQRKRQRK
jgi:hypothetical protein